MLFHLESQCEKFLDSARTLSPLLCQLSTFDLLRKLRKEGFELEGEENVQVLLKNWLIRTLKHACKVVPVCLREELANLVLELIELLGIKSWLISCPRGSPTTELPLGFRNDRLIRHLVSLSFVGSAGLVPAYIVAYSIAPRLGTRVLSKGRHVCTQSVTYTAYAVGIGTSPTA